MAVCLLSAASLAAGPPPLPTGLGGGGETSGAPALPPGLAPKDDAPPLPAGLGTPATDDAPETEEESGLPFDFTGFWEARFGMRLRNDPYEDDVSIGESRVQLDLEKRTKLAVFRLTADLLYDGVDPRYDSPNLETGTGFIDLRQVNASFTPFDFMDVKIGRQILTWGTGDLVFINDLFPKDWNSFFTGRDDEYLKAPSDAVKVSFFSGMANLDIVYVPRFDADRSIDGRRISYWNDTLGRRAGRDAIVRADRPDRWFDDDEVHVRLARNVGSVELAAYGYHGFWKSPAGMDPVTMRAIHPRLNVVGASVRGPLAGGIGNLEAGYYDSRDDRDGDDPFVRNSEARFLAGFERDVGSLFPGDGWARDLTLGAQYYLEHMLDHGDYRRTLPPGSRARDENRHLLTLRLTKLLLNQNLTLGLFTYWSPSDRDFYLRPRAHYKIRAARGDVVERPRPGGKPRAHYRT